MILAFIACAIVGTIAAQPVLALFRIIKGE